VRVGVEGEVVGEWKLDAGARARTGEEIWNGVEALRRGRGRRAAAAEAAYFIAVPLPPGSALVDQDLAARALPLDLVAQAGHPARVAAADHARLAAVAASGHDDSPSCLRPRLEPRRLRRLIPTAHV
jgi:hypothetical protein